jgi:hypothetical protein
MNSVFYQATTTLVILSFGRLLAFRVHNFRSFHFSSYQQKAPCVVTVVVGTAIFREMANGKIQKPWS